MLEMIRRPVDAGRPYLLAASALGNAQYHQSDGVSKSVLDDIAIHPAIAQWKKWAPVDTTKTGALDMGSALHARLLEPHLFPLEYAVEPILDRRTKAGKETAAAFIESSQGKTILTHDQGRRLDLMVASALAYPGVAQILEAPGVCESSIFWVDSETEELCRCRPDKIIDPKAFNRHMIIDVKKVADMDRFKLHLRKFRYHVQDAMYTDGYYQLFNEYPVFAFLAISETANCGRYPVRLFILENKDKQAGWDLYRDNLRTYHECRINNAWGGFETISMGAWRDYQEDY